MREKTHNDLAELLRQSNEMMDRVASLPSVYDLLDALAQLGVIWRRVNEEEFEYAIVQVRHGDSFLKLRSGMCLRRPILKHDTATRDFQQGGKLQ